MYEYDVSKWVIAWYKMIATTAANKKGKITDNRNMQAAKTLHNYNKAWNCIDIVNRLQAYSYNAKHK